MWSAINTRTHTHNDARSLNLEASLIFKLCVLKCLVSYASGSSNKCQTATRAGFEKNTMYKPSLARQEKRWCSRELNWTTPWRQSALDNFKLCISPALASYSWDSVCVCVCLFFASASHIYLKGIVEVGSCQWVCMSGIIEYSSQELCITDRQMRLWNYLYCMLDRTTRYRKTKLKPTDRQFTVTRPSIQYNTCIITINTCIITITLLCLIQ